MSLPFLSHKRPPAFSPLDLFRGGRVGAYFDFTRLSSMTQAIDGTGAAPAVDNDPVGRITDLFSGKQMAASTTTRRPLLYSTGGLVGIEFDGSDDCLVGTAAWDFTGGGPEWTIAAAIRHTGGQDSGRILAATTAWYSNANAVTLTISTAATGTMIVGARGGGTFATNETGANTPPISSVCVASYDMDGGSTAGQLRLQYNGAYPSLTPGGTYSAGSSLGNHTWYCGAEANASNRFGGIIFAMLIVNKKLTGVENRNLNKHFRILAGI